MSANIFLPVVFFLASAMAAAAPLTPELSLSADEKLTRIGEEQLKPGETVVLSEDELNSYLQYDYASSLPEGVRDLRVTMFKGGGMVEAWVDMSKLQSANGSSNFILMALMQGERKVRAKCRYEGAEGQAKVEIEEFEIDGTVLKGTLLDLLVKNVVAPNVKDFDVTRPVPLGYNLKSVKVEPGIAHVTSN